VIITFLYLQRELKVAKVEVSLWKVMESESWGRWRHRRDVEGYLYTPYLAILGIEEEWRNLTQSRYYQPRWKIGSRSRPPFPWTKGSELKRGNDWYIYSSSVADYRVTRSLNACKSQLREMYLTLHGEVGLYEYLSRVNQGRQLWKKYEYYRLLPCDTVQRSRRGTRAEFQIEWV
jgi:hypothetical protein